MNVKWIQRHAVYIHAQARSHIQSTVRATHKNTNLVARIILHRDTYIFTFSHRCETILSVVPNSGKRAGSDLINLYNKAARNQVNKYADRKFRTHCATRNSIQTTLSKISMHETTCVKQNPSSGTDIRLAFYGIPSLLSLSCSRWASSWGRKQAFSTGNASDLHSRNGRLESRPLKRMQFRYLLISSLGFLSKDQLSSLN